MPGMKIAAIVTPPQRAAAAARVALALLLAALTACTASGSAVGQPLPEKGAHAGELLPEELEVVQLINGLRAARGLPSHRVNAALCRAARRHAESMAARDRLSHVLDGKGPTERALVEGFAGPVAENVAAGIGGTPRAFFDLWLASRAHRENLLRPGAGQMGVGWARGGRGAKVYCAAMFGNSP